LLTTEPRIEVIGTAIDPYIAREKILKLNPDVLLMDIGLPRLDGLSFLRAIMQHRPMPVIVVSGLVGPGSDLEDEALDAGAFDVFHKPEGELSIGGLSTELVEKILEAANYSRPRQGNEPEQPPVVPTPRSKIKDRNIIAGSPAREVVLMGASTGGTEALFKVLTQLPEKIPGICIVQHIPANFSKAFASRLNLHCAFEVREAADGDKLHAGLALVAPGGRHMTLHWQASGYYVHLNDAPRVHHQRPAVDVLFDSAVTAAGANAVAVLLTGMGRDGAAGMKHLHECGAATLAQDKASCVVFGMPNAAQQLGAVDAMVTLSEMPGKILQCLQRRRSLSQLK
jgi:two-component system, chemotaxis family, protein-glutamate methylesterase/glutaminase